MFHLRQADIFPCFTKYEKFCPLKYFFSNKTLPLENFTKIGNMFKTYKYYKNGGEVLIHQLIDRKSSDFNNILAIAGEFAKQGKVVQLTPVLHHKSEAYKEIYETLAGTKYDWKCPDLKIDDLFMNMKVSRLHSDCANSSGCFHMEASNHPESLSITIKALRMPICAVIYTRRFGKALASTKYGLTKKAKFAYCLKEQHPDKIRVCRRADP